MSQDNRNANDIERELAATREEMARTVDALVEQLQPSYQIEQAKSAFAKKTRIMQADLKVKAQDFATQARQTVEDAKGGDREAMKRLGIAAGVAIATVALLILRFRPGR
ncbi:MAG: DUF3618 domain-containing protein [Actinomycetaceae bacterium]|nr:DUF3618 domain-containing protein [Actinomycetaceae bacterium]